MACHLYKVRSVLFYFSLLFVTNSCTRYFSPIPTDINFASNISLFDGQFSLADLLILDSIPNDNDQVLLFENEAIDTLIDLSTLLPEDSAYQKPLNLIQQYYPLPILDEPVTIRSKGQIDVLNAFAPSLVSTFNTAQLDSLLFKGFQNNTDTLKLKIAPQTSLIKPTSISSGSVTLTATNKLNFKVTFTLSLSTNNSELTSVNFILNPGESDSTIFHFNQELLGLSTQLKIHSLHGISSDSLIYIDNNSATLEFSQKFKRLHSEHGHFYPKDTLIALDTISIPLPIHDKTTLKSLSVSSFKLNATYLLDSIGDFISIKEFILHEGSTLSSNQHQITSSVNAFPTENFVPNHRFTSITKSPKFVYEVHVSSAFPVIWYGGNSNIEASFSPEISRIYSAEFLQDKTLVVETTTPVENPFRDNVTLINFKPSLAKAQGIYLLNAWGKLSVKQEFSATNSTGATSLITDSVEINLAASSFTDSAKTTEFKWAKNESTHEDLTEIVSVMNEELHFRNIFAFEAPFGVLFSQPLSIKTKTEHPFASDNASVSLSGEHTFNVANSVLDSILHQTDSITINSSIKINSNSPFQGVYELLHMQDTLVSIPILVNKDSAFLYEEDKTIYDILNLAFPMRGKLQGSFKDTVRIQASDSVQFLIRAKLHNTL